MTFDIGKITVPSDPGIYIMRDEKNDTLYIGKTKNLKNRVKSYFVGSHDIKTVRLVEKIHNIEFVLTRNEAEAFLLESSLIKQYRPRYNIELKDQQRYTYLKITDELYPRLVVARRTRGGKFIGKGKVYGPFTRGSSKLLTIGSLRKAFKVRICKTLPKKACLEYHLGNCDAPCEFKPAQKQYTKHIEELNAVLHGGKPAKEFTARLHKQMQKASASLEFERALGIRDTLERLGALYEGQSVERLGASPDEDFVGMLRTNNNGTALVMTVKQIRGVIRDTERFSFDIMADNTLSNFVYQYYTTRKVPRYIVSSQQLESAAKLEKILAKSCGHDVSIVVPVRGKRMDIIKMIMKSLETVRMAGAQPGLVELRDVLGLPGIPRVIECFDISNHGADYAVGAMSCLVNGQTDTSRYRRFKIRTVSGRDDYAMIFEVIRRRYMRLADQGTKLPDLVLIDGGRGQLNAAIRALEEVSIKIPCASLAKRIEEVFVPNHKEAIILGPQSDELQVLQRARDEAHRFGVSYNRRVRKSRMEN